MTNLLILQVANEFWQAKPAVETDPRPLSGGEFLNMFSSYDEVRCY